MNDYPCEWIKKNWDSQGGGQNDFVITLHRDESTRIAKADKTRFEIEDAYQSGKSLVLKDEKYPQESFKFVTRTVDMGGYNFVFGSEDIDFDLYQSSTQTMILLHIVRINSDTQVTDIYKTATLSFT